jgi:hypothetical protein
MKREVVQDFLNLPGIMGVALIHGRSRPYFCGVDQILNFQQKEALAQGIQQVIETTPVSFEFFEFQFNGHQIYIYKLEHGVILLVLTVDDLAYEAYAEIIEQLKAELQENVADAIATFRLLAGSNTLTRQNYWKNQSETTGTLSQFRPAVEPPAPKAAPPAPATTLQEVLVALNSLSQFTIHYLGTSVVVGNWKSTRPSAEWLNQFQIERSAQITFNGASSCKDVLSAEQHQWVRAWVTAFVERCSKIIRNFPKTVRQKGLDPHQQALLFSDSE